MKTPQYIDIHAHVNFTDFAADRDEVIERAQAHGVAMINIGTHHNTSIEVVRLTEKYDSGVYAIVGLHPINVGKEEFREENYAALLSHPKVVGVGECGLDFFHLSGDIDDMKQQQQDIFRRQIALAVAHDKPIMIHCRDAYREVLDIVEGVKRDGAHNLRGNIHFFAGSLDDARRFLDLGFTISFTGVITFAQQYRELVSFVPLDRIHAETDCPYVAPVPHRGKRNEPLYVIDVVKKIAEIKRISEHDVAAALVQNATNLFQLPF